MAEDFLFDLSVSKTSATFPSFSLLTCLTLGNLSVVVLSSSLATFFGGITTGLGAVSYTHLTLPTKRIV